jgi:hypothetical protein
MEQYQPEPPTSPAPVQDSDRKQEYIGRQFANGLQFEEAVQRLREEYDKHPKQPRDPFY